MLPLPLCSFVAAQMLIILFVVYDDAHSIPPTYFCFRIQVTEIESCKIVLLKSLIQKPHDVVVPPSSSNVYEQTLIEMIGDLELGNHPYMTMDEIEKTFRFRLEPGAAVKGAPACVNVNPPRPIDRNKHDDGLQVTTSKRRCGTIVGKLIVVFWFSFVATGIVTNFLFGVFF